MCVGGARARVRAQVNGCVYVHGCLRAQMSARTRVRAWRECTAMLTPFRASVHAAMGQRAAARGFRGAIEGKPELVSIHDCSKQ